MGKLLLGPATVACDLTLNLFGIETKVRQGGAQLRFGKPMVGFAQPGVIAIQAFVRRDDFPDIEAGAGNAGSPPGRSIGKNNSRTPFQLNGFCK